MNEVIKPQVRHNLDNQEKVKRTCAHCGLGIYHPAHLIKKEAGQCPGDAEVVWKPKRS